VRFATFDKVTIHKTRASKITSTTEQTRARQESAVGFCGVAVARRSSMRLDPSTRWA
jgi:hypothetical protein